MSINANDQWSKKLKNPPKQYRPAPFWSWNEKLDPAETVRQVGEMDDAGLGGYFMHARGGLQTDYLSEEWFNNILAATREGEKREMHSWGYDENGWPSGFGGGIVNGMGERYQQKYLRHEVTEAPVHQPHTVTNVTVGEENHHLYYDINPFYVDTLDDEVIDAFLASTHAVYRDRMGKEFGKMDGFFTDEPQVSRNGIPWSLILDREYTTRYGKSILPALPGLFVDIPGCAVTRYRFWKLVRDLFAENYMGRIYRWCNDNGVRLTGHMVLEEGFYDHILSNGCCMPPYEYMDIPGMDNLGRNCAWVQTEMQLSSVAHQLGKKQILSETFAMCGWNVNFEELRKIYEHQMVHGINYLCQHLEGYSLRGIRKRDYPASLFRHQPWWGEYRLFNDMVSRIGMLLAEGEVHAPILVLHTVESGWVNLRDGEAESANAICWPMLETMTSLEEDQLQYHLGDGRILERHGKVENGMLTVGTQQYSVIIVPPSVCFGENTYRLLSEFKAQGGTLLFTEQIPTLIDGIPTDKWEKLADGCSTAPHKAVAAAVPDSARQIALRYERQPKTASVLATLRRFPDREMTMVYLVNPTDHARQVSFTVDGGSATRFDAFGGEEVAAEYTAAAAGQGTVSGFLPQNGSAVFFIYDDADHPAVPSAPAASVTDITAKLKGDWEIVSGDLNALTLDYADVFFDGEPAGTHIPISDVQEMACAFGRPVKTDVVYSFDVAEKDFSVCRLVIETPEIFTVTVNGHPVSEVLPETYFDRCFKMLDIAPFVHEGHNEIKCSCLFDQSATVRDNLQKSLEFESEKNKLSYDMEIEAVYIIGDFGVVSDRPMQELPHRGIRADGSFSVTAAPRTVTDGALAGQGFPFFAGRMTFRKTVTLTAEEAANAQLTFRDLCSNVTTVTVNGQNVGTVMWHPYTVDIADACHEGENTVEITVIGNLRNLLGPFHLTEGESLGVCPPSFFHRSPLWLHGDNPNWTDTYCFVEYGLFF